VNADTPPASSGPLWSRESPSVTIAGPAANVRPAAALALFIGITAAAVYCAQGLTLSHYDAKAHLVVARRILDSLQPGWMQIGAVWLPLPHLLNLWPVQIDWLYQTGWSAVILSIGGFVLGATSLWWLIARATRSRGAAWAGFTVFAAQPDVLYLQATPMTEPLLMGLCLLGVALTWRWVSDDARGRIWPIGTTFALACLTRYEAWPVTVVTVVLAGVVLFRRGLAPDHVVRRLGALAAYPLAAVIAFFFLSRATVGAWLVTDGFYDIEPAFYQRPLAGIAAVAYGLATLNGYAMLAVGILAFIVLLRSIAHRPASAPLIVVLALAACVALPLYAFWNGHPFRIRYMVPLTMVLAAVIGLGVGLLPRGRRIAATLVLLVGLVETPPLSGRSPMVLEAQWDRPRTLERQRVTACLRERYDDTPILASMGSLAHYMHETAPAGFALRQYIHEGLGDLWKESLLSPRQHAGWILIAEQAMKRDQLARVKERLPGFLDGFERLCEGGGVTLYRRLATEYSTSGAHE
jgi:hypothetical protein